MENYTVGQECKGLIVNSYKDDLVVELEPGVIGIIAGGVSGCAYSMGDLVTVEIVAIEGETYYLRLVTSEISEDSGDVETAPWDNWEELPTGHTQATVVLRLLREHADAFLNELRNARREWENAKSNSQKTYDTLSSSAREQFETEKNGFITSRDNNVQICDKRTETVATVVFAADYFANSVTGLAQSAAKSRISEIRERQKDVLDAIEKKKNAYRELCAFYIAGAERTMNDKLDKARKEQIDRDDQADQRFDMKGKKTCAKYRDDIAAGFNKDTVHAYVSKIKSSRFNAESYDCRTVIPDFVMLGSIGITIPNKTQDETSVVQAIELQAGELGQKDSDGYVVEIPYAQRLSEGISLLMRYSPEDRNNVQRLIQPLLVNLFLSFPAGKLEATMIDPLEMGASFSDIPKLVEGPNSARMIDTKIWSKEKDIETAIATLRQRLENMTQSYGGDQATRLKKESLRVLAVTDFPIGFNDTALKDLHAIVRNSASLGVCVLICANDQELETLKRRNGTLYSEIAQSLIETKAYEDKLMLVGEPGGRMYIRVDDMQDVFAKKAEIFKTYSFAAEHAVLKVEPFDSMFDFDIYDSNNWFTGSHDEIAIPIGIKGADTVVKMIMGKSDGSTEHHALISGISGAGKSTFLHTLIMSTLISYSPDEVQMYLLDFKEGVEFNIYTKYRLPSLRVVAIKSEREFGLSVLSELCTELESRSRYFNHYGKSDINGYYELTDVPKIPKLLLIFDEVQELFRSDGQGDSIANECLSCINKLVMQGRAMGIHIILACQDFRNCSGLEAYFTQMTIRIAIKGTVDGASSILNAGNEEDIRSLQGRPAGAAIYNNGGGAESFNNFFQISYLEEKKRVKLLTMMDAYFTDPDVAPQYEKQTTRVLLTNAEDNIHNCFNRLIIHGASTVGHLGKEEDGYGLLIGQGFGKKFTFTPELCRQDGDNMIVVTHDEKMAMSIFEMSVLSILYEELHTTADKANALCYIADWSDAELSDDECDFKFLASCFDKQVMTASVRETAELINTVYETVADRIEGTKPDSERIFLFFFGIDRARILRPDGIYDENRMGELSPLEKLKKILIKGPRYGVNCIFWGESMSSIGEILGDRFAELFKLRVAYQIDDDSMRALVSENNPKSIRGKTAVYKNNEEDAKNTHFRPYDVPAKEWVEIYSEKYEEVIREGE